MSRSIKFKLYYQNQVFGYEWLDETGWHYYSIDLDTDENGNVIRTNKGTIPVHCFDLTDQPIRAAFTGQKDLKGNEIYENDIIGGQAEMVNLMSGLKTGQTKQVLQKIIWSDEQNRWTVHDLSREKPNSLGGISIPLRYYSLVGNIYENKELLEKK